MIKIIKVIGALLLASVMVDGAPQGLPTSPPTSPPFDIAQLVSDAPKMAPIPLELLTTTMNDLNVNHLPLPQVLGNVLFNLLGKLPTCFMQKFGGDFVSQFFQQRECDKLFCKYATMFITQDKLMLLTQLDLTNPMKAVGQIQKILLS